MTISFYLNKYNFELYYNNKNKNNEIILIICRNYNFEIYNEISEKYIYIYIYYIKYWSPWIIHILKVYKIPQG